MKNKWLNNNIALLKISVQKIIMVYKGMFQTK